MDFGLKQPSVDFVISSTMLISGSRYLRTARKARIVLSTYIRNGSAFLLPPIISIISLVSRDYLVSLNCAFSKPRFLPGEMSKMKPKSMWIRWPIWSIKMLPLCLSFICRM